MTHLAPDELLSLAERGAAAAQDPHLASCERCRAHVAALRDVLRTAAEVEVPEPSPLFWDHLSHRVADAVRREPARSSGWWWTPTWRGLAPLAAVVLLAVAVWFWRPDAPRPLDPSSTGNVAESRLEVLPVAAAGDDEAWEVVASLTEGVDVETVDATGIAPTPGSVDEAARELSVPERSELIRILRIETAESGTEG